MRILIACEFSGRVRDAFLKQGHDVLSCDLLPTKKDGPHYHGDLFDIIYDNWDMVIAHPPCTALCVSGNRWYANTKERKMAIEFVEKIWNVQCKKMSIENPVGVLSTQSKLGKPKQYIQPWQFGCGETKKTGLWLRGLPKLKPTKIVSGREQKIWKMPPSKDRWMKRSITYQGIADAMAKQWG